MSWTIPVPSEPSPAQKLFEKAVRDAAERNVLMFCSSPDEGNFNNLDYPSSVQRDKIFRIGAAHDYGTASMFVDKDVDFIFPGVQVNTSATSVATGSSIGTALAAGLAATIIYCFKISALAVKTQTQTVSDTENSRRMNRETDLRKVSQQHATMKAAFSRIGRVNDAKFIQIWDELDPLVLQFDRPDNADRDVKVDMIMDLCKKLV